MVLPKAQQSLVFHSQSPRPISFGCRPQQGTQTRFQCFATPSGTLESYKSMVPVNLLKLVPLLCLSLLQRVEDCACTRAIAEAMCLLPSLTYCLQDHLLPASHKQNPVGRLILEVKCLDVLQSWEIGKRISKQA